MRLNLASKVSLLTISLVLISGVAIALLINHLSQAALESHALNLRADALAKPITMWQTELARLEEDVKILSTAPEVYKTLSAVTHNEENHLFWKAQLASSLQNYARNRPHYMQIRLIGVADNGLEIVRVERIKGNIITTPENNLQQKGGRDYIREALGGQQGEVIFSDVNLNREHGEVSTPHTPVIRAITPIFLDMTTLAGFIVINLNVSTLLQQFNDAVPKHSELTVVNQNGEILQHPNPLKNFAFEFGRKEQLARMDPLLSRAIGNDGAQGEFQTIEQPERFTQWTKLSLDSPRYSRHIALLLATPSEYITSLMEDLRYSVLGVTAAMVTIALLLALLFARHLTKPLQEMSRSVTRIANNDYDAPLPVQYEDEIGDMAKSIKDMAHKICDQRESLQLFSKAMAHDLKEPIRTTKSYIHLITSGKMGRFGEQMAGQLKHILIANQRMEELVDMVSVYTQIDREASIEQVSINSVVHDAIANVNAMIEDRGAEVCYTKNLPDVIGNKVQLVQLFQNLISNSIKYCDKPIPSVSIDYAYHKDQRVFVVQDNGIGIDESSHERIFEPFSRLHTKDEYAGTGIGLAICAKIVQKHGGTIWCESEPGKGSQFYFSFENVLEPQNDVMDVSFNPSDKKEKSMKSDQLANILVAEDNHADVELLKIVFQANNVEFNLSTVTDGKKVMDCLYQRGGFEDAPRPELIMLDINMPVMDGHETLEAIKSDPKFDDIPVVMLSTSNAEEDKERALKNGAYHYFTKPPEVDKFLLIVSELSKIYVKYQEDKKYLLNTDAA